MDDRASERGPLEKLTLAGLGGLSLLAESADELATELGRRLGIEREEVREAIADVIDSWRREASRVTEGTGETAARVIADLGLASRSAVDDLELRVAQLEHRLKLLERGPAASPPSP